MMFFQAYFAKLYDEGGIVQMKSIRKQRNGYALLFAAGICLAVWLGMAFMLEAVFAFGAISLISLLLLVRQSRLLYDATLIWDNRILAVPSALISTEGSLRQADTEETVVSTFGMLIGRRIYRWGLDGVHGVRLSAVQIDKERMYLIFGDKDQTMRVELLHGMLHKQTVVEAAQKLWHETGIRAEISDW
jgi:hypothetical protein